MGRSLHAPPSSTSTLRGSGDIRAVGTEDRLDVLDDHLGVASMACHQASAYCARRGRWVLNRQRSYRPRFHCPFRLVEWAVAVKCRGCSAVSVVVGGGVLIVWPSRGRESGRAQLAASRFATA